MTVSTLNVSEYIASTSDIKNLMDLGFKKSELEVLIAPPRTLKRRKDKLSLIESDRVNRINRIMQHGKRVFGSYEKTNKWLRRPSMALNNAQPIELLISETGAHEVDQVLHAIDYGIYA